LESGTENKACATLFNIQALPFQRTSDTSIAGFDKLSHQKGFFSENENDKEDS
jgi:hypothetical protein